MNCKKILACVMIVSVLLGNMTIGFAKEENKYSDDFSMFLHEQFDDPEIIYRPEVRWWMDGGSHTDQTLKEDIAAIADMGFGAAEFLAMDSEDGLLDYSKYGWGSEEWIEDTKLIIKEATQNGLGFSLTSGTNWSNANLPDTYEIEDGVWYSPDHPSSGKEISYTQLDIEAGERFRGELPKYEFQDEKLKSIVTEQILVTVIAAGIIDDSLNSDDTFVIENIDVTETGVEVDWEAPQNKSGYRLFAIWQHGAAEENKPSVSNNYTVNYVDPDGIQALMDYWEEYILTPDMLELIKENGRGELYMDSLELSGHGNASLLWGSTLLDEFEVRWGYRIDEYIPFLFNSGGRLAGGALLGFGNFNEYPIDSQTGRSGNEKIDQIRNDFYQTLTELYIRNVLEPLRKWLEPIGMTLRAEVSYGGEFYEIGQAVKAVDKIETESLEFGSQIDAFRNFSGPAHLYGKPLSSETGAMAGVLYQTPLDTFNQIIYTQMASGIGRTVLHVYASQWGHEGSSEWPGYAGQSRWTERWDQRQPASEHYREWTAMIARNQKALQQGIPRVDLGILRNDYMTDNFLNGDDWDNNGMLVDEGLYWQDLSLQNAGYTYDYFSPLLLTDEDIIYKDGVVQPNGPGYKALIVYQEEISIDSAKILLEWAAEGLPIIFVNGAEELGRPNLMGHMGYGERYTVQHSEAAMRTLFYTEDDRELADTMAAVKRFNNVKEVHDQAEVYDTLLELDVYPRAEFSETNNKILTYMRRDEQNNVLYLYAYNYKPGHSIMASWESLEEPHTVEVAIDEIGKPYELNAWTGEVEPMGYQLKEERTFVEITLDPGATTMIAIDLSSKAAEEIYPIESTADKLISGNSFNNSIKVDRSGTYKTKLSDGSEIVNEVYVPEDIELNSWNLTVETWTKGDLETRVEDKGRGYVTKEYRYGTAKTKKAVGILDELKPWNELGVHESGIGTYTAYFELPEDWDDKNGAELQLGSIFRNSAVAYINGNRIPVPLESLKVDVTKYLKAGGTNEIIIEVASTLNNSLAYEPQRYGIVGKTVLATYTVEKLEQEVFLESISAKKVKTAYKVGEKLTVDDLIVSAFYSNNSSRQVTNYVTNASAVDMNTSGAKALVVTYTENDISKETTVMIKVDENNIPMDTGDESDSTLQTRGQDESERFSGDGKTGNIPKPPKTGDASEYITMLAAFGISIMVLLKLIHNKRLKL